jgi:putative photosynthetic complex assembly protein
MPTFDQKIPMKHGAEEMVPKPVVYAMFGLMLGAVGLVAFAQLAGLPKVGVLVEAPVVQERAVVLSGDRNGAYVVTDPDGTVIAASSDDKAGFIGVIGMVVKRERHTQGLTSDEPVRIVRRENGNIAIIDDTTGLVIELIGYGADNVAAFANLLD